uniref:Helicase ATP-binding domain-containing protein n=1 Tax=viral metagenome TaxID=1070528 RepID=A0A6C0DQW2_9ZZZZ
MVVICNKPYPTESQYDDTFNGYPYPLSDFQKYSIQSILEGNHVLVTAHTGSGKTLPAEFAIQHFTELGKKVIYTSPIKALSNQKYYEFTKKYEHISFGLFTGDIKTNPDANVLIMTTEILMNNLFKHSSQINTFIGEKDTGNSPFCSHLATKPRIDLKNDSKLEKKSDNLDFNVDIHSEVACVIFDECHYINDSHRGQVWENCIMMLPPHIQMILLSATIDNPQGFAKWCETGRFSEMELESMTDKKQVYLASTNKRVVPLSHYGYLTTSESIFKGMKDKELEKQIRSGTNCLIPLQNENGLFSEKGVHQLSNLMKIFDKKQVMLKRKHVLNSLALFLKEREMLPAIAFIFSRKNVEACAKEITTNLLEDDSKVPYIVSRECEQIIRKLPNYQEYLQLPEYVQLVSLLEKGIGIHHSGMMPILREIVELMISKKYIKLLFATESFAIGLDCPIRTAIFTSLTKFDGQNQRLLMSHEYTQMAGRAGRRGIDTVGHVVHCNNLFTLPTMNEYKNLLSGKPQQLVSKYHISYSLILNLLKNGGFNEFHKYSEKSMIQNEVQKSINAEKVEIDTYKKQRGEILEKSLSYLTMPYEKCEEWIRFETALETAVNKKRRDIEKGMREIENEYPKYKQDVKMVKDYKNYQEEVKSRELSIKYMEEFILSQTNKTCDVLLQEGFIEKVVNLDNSGYQLTSKGRIASNIAEVNPLIFAKLMVDEWNYFEDFTVKQLIGLFSCFTDIKVSDDRRVSVPLTEDIMLKNRIIIMADIFQLYNTIECEQDIRSGINYDEALCFDIIDESIKWSLCDTEDECKYFIQTNLADKEISVGDFNKAMLKIVTISKELSRVSEEYGFIDLLYKLNQIEKTILKYITTSQSLYV